MPESGSRAGVFEAISVVALVFMVAGIGIAVIQWVSYDKEPPPVPRGNEAAHVNRLGGGEDEGDADDDDDEAGLDAGGGAEELEPGGASKPDKNNEGDDKAPGGEEELEH